MRKYLFALAGVVLAGLMAWNPAPADANPVPRNAGLILAYDCTNAAHPSIVIKATKNGSASLTQVGPRRWRVSFYPDHGYRFHRDLFQPGRSKTGLIHASRGPRTGEAAYWDIPISVLDGC